VTATAWCRVADIPSPSYQAWLGVSWAMALLLGLLLAATGRRRGRSHWESAGFAILGIPAWMVFIEVLPDMAKTFCAQGDIVSILPGRPSLPPAAWHFSNQYIDGIVRNLGYIALGALLVVHGRNPTWWRHPPVAAAATSLRGLLPMGPGELPSLRLGIALFPLLALANLALAAVTGIALRTADKSAYYTNVTPYHAVMLALAAAFAEELVYRGVMQQGIRAGLHRLSAQGNWPAVAAIALQAIPFAYAHAGYGNPQLLLFAFLFAILSGAAAQWLGIWCAIALHALIDFYVFFLAVPEPGFAFVAVVAIVTVGVLVTADLEAWQQWARRRLHAS